MLHRARRSGRSRRLRVRVRARAAKRLAPRPAVCATHTSVRRGDGGSTRSATTGPRASGSATATARPAHPDPRAQAKRARRSGDGRQPPCLGPYFRAASCSSFRTTHPTSINSLEYVDVCPTSGPYAGEMPASARRASGWASLYAAPGDVVFARLAAYIAPSASMRTCSALAVC
jgi:hypothetical protein